jgi:hypothetical protein
VGDAVVSLAGAAGSVLCPVGVAAHHMPFHAGRVRVPVRAGAVEEIRKAMANGPVAVLDMRPGRTASLVHRRFAASVAGLYVVPAHETFAVDLGKVKTLVSFGAPVLDGWGTPARVLGARANLRLVQIEPVESRTASLADEWVPLKPGTEAALALGLACALGAKFAAAFTPERVADVTGIAPQTIVRLARAIRENGPAVAIADAPGPEAENAIAGLNTVLRGPLVRRREAPGAPDQTLAVPMALAGVPDAGIALLLVDEAPGGNTLPWSVLKRKLAPKAVVVAMTSSGEGIARYADYVIPAPVFPETLQDGAGAVDQPAAQFSLAMPLTAKPEWAVEPAEFVMRLAGEAGTLEDELKRRVEAIQKSKRGVVVNYPDSKQTPAKEIEDLWKVLAEGAVWIDDAAPEPAQPEFSAVNLERALAEQVHPLTAVSSCWRGGPVPPLVSKLWVESDLRAAPGVARMHPETARRYGIEDGRRAALRTASGTSIVTAACDAALMPGVVEVAVGPGGEAALETAAPATLTKA